MNKTFLEILIFHSCNNRVILSKLYCKISEVFKSLTLYLQFIKEEKSLEHSKCKKTYIFKDEKLFSVYDLKRV